MANFQQFIGEAKPTTRGSTISPLGAALGAVGQIAEAGLQVRDVVQTGNLEDKLGEVREGLDRGRERFSELQEDVRAAKEEGDDINLSQAESGLDLLFSGQDQGRLTPSMANRKAADLVLEYSTRNPRIASRVSAMARGRGFNVRGSASSTGAVSGSRRGEFGLTAAQEEELNTLAFRNNMTPSQAYSKLVELNTSQNEVALASAAAVRGNLDLPNLNRSLSAVVNLGLMDGAEGEGGSLLVRMKRELDEASGSAAQLAVMQRYKVHLEGLKAMATAQGTEMWEAQTASGEKSFTGTQVDNAVKRAVTPIDFLLKSLDTMDPLNATQVLATTLKNQNALHMQGFNQLLASQGYAEYISVAGPDVSNSLYTKTLPSIIRMSDGISEDSLKALALTVGASGSDEARRLIQDGDRVRAVLDLWREYNTGVFSQTGARVNRIAQDYAVAAVNASRAAIPDPADVASVGSMVDSEVTNGDSRAFGTAQRTFFVNNPDAWEKTKDTINTRLVATSSPQSFINLPHDSANLSNKQVPVESISVHLSTSADLKGHTAIGRLMRGESTTSELGIMGANPVLTAASIGGGVVQSLLGDPAALQGVSEVSGQFAMADYEVRGISKVLRAGGEPSVPGLQESASIEESHKGVLLSEQSIMLGNIFQVEGEEGLRKFYQEKLAPTYAAQGVRVYIDGQLFGEEEPRE